MYKYLQLFLFCVFTNAVSFAQTNQVEAKAAYLLAEESYGKGDMKSTVQYLDDAVSKLGGPNAKILYLKIMAQRELANKDQAYLAGLDSTITVFQKLPDISTFNEDKVLEITKIKLQLKKEIDQKTVFDESRIGISSVEREYPDWPLGASLETIRQKHPDIFLLLDSKVYKKNIKRDYDGDHYKIPNSDNGVNEFHILNNRLKNFEVLLYRFPNDGSEHSSGKEAYAKFALDYQNRLGKRSPTVHLSGNGYYSETYGWLEGRKTVILSFFSDPFGYTSISLTLIDHSFD